VSVRVVKGGGL